MLFNKLLYFLKVIILKRYVFLKFKDMLDMNVFVNKYFLY